MPTTLAPTHLKRIAYLKKMIALHLRTFDEEVARGVDAQWLLRDYRANVAELAALEGVQAELAKPITTTAADRAYEARMGRRLRRSF